MIIVLDINICTNKNTPLKYTASLESYVHAYVCVFMCEHESLCVHMHVCVGRRLWSNIVLNHTGWRRHHSCMFSLSVVVLSRGNFSLVKRKSRQHRASSRLVGKKKLHWPVTATPPVCLASDLQLDSDVFITKWEMAHFWSNSRSGSVLLKGLQGELDYIQTLEVSPFQKIPP